MAYFLKKTFPYRRGFFLIDLMQLRIICWENRCIILDTKPASGSASGDEKLGSKSATILVRFHQLFSACKVKNYKHEKIINLTSPLSGDSSEFSILLTLSQLQQKHLI